MQDPMEMDNSDDIDPSEYVRLQEEYEEKLDEFMRKHLRRTWPVCVIRLLGIFQLLVTLTIFGVDLPIILMFAPRWQVFAGCWASVLGFIACVSTLHSSRKMTWSKLKWTAGLNILGGIAVALMVAFDILYLVNSKICLIASGCNYLSYTYSPVKPFYTAEVVMVFVFLVLFIKHGIGGITLFENIQKGWAPPIYKPIVPPNDTMPMLQNPMTRPGMMMPPSHHGPMPMPPQAGPRMMMRPPPPGSMPLYQAPPPGSMPPYQAPIPGAMMPRPGAPMMPRPGAPMMMPGARPPMQGYYRQPGPYAAPPRPY
ncbi:unnamed protein product [Rotaria sp. Silwood1]|nr:unnamed protein product [Rotaria sp. Silwood1]